MLVDEGELATARAWEKPPSHGSSAAWGYMFSSVHVGQRQRL